VPGEVGVRELKERQGAAVSEAVERVAELLLAIPPELAALRRRRGSNFFAMPLWTAPHAAEEGDLAWLIQRIYYLGLVVPFNWSERDAPIVTPPARDWPMLRSPMPCAY